MYGLDQTTRLKQGTSIEPERSLLTQHINSHNNAAPNFIQLFPRDQIVSHQLRPID